MRAPKLFRAFFGIFAVVLLAGCGSDPEDTCEDLCEYASRCSDVEVSCTQTDKDQCVSQLEDLSSSCQSAVGDFYGCVNDVDSCSDEELQSECGSELGDVIEECAGEDPLDE
jgi:outer membrane lipoprotein-sorting protein